jgi:hypothetical protein
MPKTVQPSSLTSLHEKLIKIGAKVTSHGRWVTFQLAEVAVSRQMFADILMPIARLRAATRASMTEAVVNIRQPTVQLRLCGGAVATSSTMRRPTISSRTVSSTPLRPRGSRPQRTIVRRTNVTNIAAYVVARIVLAQLSGRTSGKFETNL